VIPWVVQGDRKVKLIDLGAELAKIPRPERSGLLSMGMCLAIAFSLLTSTSVNEIDLSCILRPAKCVTRVDISAERKPQRWITFSPVAENGKRACTCHSDIQYYGKPIQHLHYSNEESCESPDLWNRANEWIPALPSPIPLPPDVNYIAIVVTGDEGQQYEINVGQGQYRYHCTDDDRK
jgi:hypothetical protein